MSLTPFLEAGPLIQAHAASAVFAALLGALIFWRPKGGRAHRWMGRLWALAMAVAIASSAFISEIRLWGPFSPVHLLTLLGAWGLGRGVFFALTGQVAAHEASMKGLYFWALMVAGVFTFLPGRVMNRALFPDHPVAGFWAVLGLYLAALALSRRRRSRLLAKA